jgi:hypothetical protein
VRVQPKNLKDDCLTDAQNCDYFKFFNRKEKRLYVRFLDKVEANFEGTEAKQAALFLTLTFNTTQDNLYAFTTNTDPNDECWQPISEKLKKWAWNFDPNCETRKILLRKMRKEDVSNYEKASQYLTKFLRSVRTKWKPQNWKWVVVAELQKNGVWHFHLISTPIVPYAHKCRLDKNFASCWNCRGFLTELWPYGRVESRSPGKKTLGQYLAKYLAKSFHLRSLYQQHGFKEHNKAYRFFKNLYEYDEKAAVLIGQGKFAKASGQRLNGNQHLFRRADNTYFYRTNEKQVGEVAQPLRLNKNFRLTTNLNPRNLKKLAKKSRKKPTLELNFGKRKKKIFTNDFQEFLITSLLAFCQQAEFSKVPLEAEQVPKEGGRCDKSVFSHFRTKSVLRFTFAPENAELAHRFFTNLDTYAEEYEAVEAKDFFLPQLTDPIISRNAYLNQWESDYFLPWQRENIRSYWHPDG